MLKGIIERHQSSSSNSADQPALLAQLGECPTGDQEIHYQNKPIQIQWNLGNSNANFSKLPDFSKTTDGPEFFHYNLLQKYHQFFEFQFFE